MRILYLVTIIAFIGTFNTQAQFNFEFDSATPNVAGIIRSGNIPVKKFTGEIDVSVPIYTINTRNFNLPISLGYSNAGLIPSRQCGPVGYGWFLNAGGVIHRKVIGLPDESFNNQNREPLAASSDRVETHGFIYGVNNRNKHKVGEPTKTEIYLEDQKVFYDKKALLDMGDGTMYETMPDEFSFNFGGYSGKFFMSYDGEVKVITNTPNNFEVDLSELKFIDKDVRDNVNNFKSAIGSKIKIKTDDGYTYVFGGDLSNTEFSFSVLSIEDGFIRNQPAEEDPKLSPSPVANSWYLAEIIAPDGESMIFNYKKGITENLPNLSDFNATNPPPVVVQAYHSKYRDPWIISSLFNYGDPSVYHLKTRKSGPSDQEHYDTTTISLKTVSYLEGITIPGKIQLTFDYSVKSRKFYSDFKIQGGDFTGHLTLSKINVPSYQLDEIKIEDLSQVTKKVVNTFNFQYRMGVNRIFLKKVIEKGRDAISGSDKAYSFDYKGYIFPNPLTLGIDHWGFYNGKDNNKYDDLLPEEEYNIKTNQFGKYTDGKIIKFKNKSRESKKDFNGLLKRIDYPTGGYTKFEYEGHEYSKRIELNETLETVGTPILHTGGARVKKIVDFDGTNFVNERSFIYEEGEKSCGILRSWPRYYVPLKIENIGKEIKVIKEPLFGGTYNSKVSFGSHIVYKKVKEVYADKSYTVSEFNTWSDQQSDIKRETNEIKAIIPPTKSRFLGLNSAVNDFSIARGKLKNEKLYDRFGNLKVENEYSYSYDNIEFGIHTTEEDIETPGVRWPKYHPQIGQNIYKGTRYFTKRYYDSNFLVRKRKTIYNKKINGKGTSEVEEVNYVYHTDYHKLMETRTDVSEKRRELAKIMIQKNRYPFSDSITKIPSDVSLNSINQNKAFLLNNNLLPVIESEVRYLTKNTKDFFEVVLSDIQLNSTFNLYNNNKLLQLNKQYVSSKNGSYVKETEYRNYTSQNLYEMESKSGLITTVLWGYNGEYPLAKIENISLNDLASILGISLSDLKNSSSANTPFLINKIEEARTIEALSNARIYSYLFQPFTGVTKVTDPRGISISYTYDEFNRLWKSFDHNQKKLTETNYKLKQTK